MTLGIAILYALGAVPATIGLLALALLGATLGFAIFNKHPAQIFLGDAGSLPIGLCLAFMLIFVAKAHLAAALLLVALHAGRRDAHAVPPHPCRGTDLRQRTARISISARVAAGLSVPQVTARVLLLADPACRARACHGDRPLAGGRSAMRRRLAC